MQTETLAELMAMGGKTETLPNGMRVDHLPILTVGPGEINLRPLILSAAIACLKSPKENQMQAATCEHGRPAGTPCPHCLGINNIVVPLTMTPGSDKEFSRLPEGNRGQIRRRRSRSYREQGFKDTIENNNEQRNRAQAEAKERAKKKATLKMKKAQRRRARA